MKRILSTIVGLGLLCAFAEAHAVPATVSFTGRLATSAGPVNGNVAVTFSLFDRATAGTALWTEARPSLLASAGLVHADLGALTTLDEGVLANDQLYLEIRIGNEILAPRLAVQSVPYSIRAEVANRAELLGALGPEDVQARVGGTCGPNASIASIGATGTVTCETDSDTTYAAAAGAGLTLSASNAFGLASCAVGQVLKSGGAGAWSCGSDLDTNTTYSATAGGGLAITAGNGVGLVTCASGQVLKAGPTAGSWACAADVDTDSNTTYAAGVGVVLTGTSFSIDSNVVARRDIITAQNFNGNIGIGVPAPRERLDVNGPIRFDGLRVFRKDGNNGSTSCAVFCEGTMWAGGRGSCLAVRGTVNGTYYSCSAVPNVPITCMCAGINE